MKNSLAPRSFVVRARKILSTVIQPAVLGLLIAHAQAGNTWTGGGGSTNWNDSGNWGGSAPVYGTLTFTTGGAQGTTSVNNSITAMNRLLWTGSSSWTLNNSGGTVLSLFDNGGTQAKIENQSTGLVTINAPITFAANNGAPPNPFGEINAVNGDITFGTGTLTVNGTSVNGVKLFGSGRTTTFNNTVTSSGKWFGLTGTNTTMAVGGAFTSGDIYAMNGGTVKLNSGGTITTSALRLGGDFGNTGNGQNNGVNSSGNNTTGTGGTLQFTSLTGGQSFASIINTVSGNTSGALLVDSLNTSGTNTISGNIFLDSALRINQASGGTLAITNATLDLKAQTLTLTGTGGNIGITGVIGNSTGSGQVVVGVNGTAGGPTATLSNANTYSGDTFVRAGTLAFTSAGSSANSTIRLGSTTGSGVDASINLTTATGGTTISSLLNPVATSGSGTLSLNSQNTSGTNAYTGLIALDRDLTVTQAAGGTLNLSGVNTKDIKANKLTVNTDGTVNISSTLTSSLGAGGFLVKQGNGILVLSSTANSYTGTNSATLNANGTQIAAGTLAIAGDTSLGIAPAGAYDNVQFTGTGTLRSDASISLNANRNISIAGGAIASLDSNGNTFTINGAIGGASGTLNKSGSGTTILNGGNSYGATTITTGTLQIGNGSTTGTLGGGAVTNNAALSFNRSNSLTVGNDISGSGSVTQSGVGTTILTGTNSYGTTTISAGTLQIGNGSTTGTLGGGAVTNNAALSFNRSNSLTVGNDISGSGSVTQSGGGTTILTGTNSYGTTTISAGTLQVGNGGATGSLGSGTVTNNAALVFNRSGNINLTNAIGGTGTLAQSGSNIITIGSANTYSGLTTINSGMLRVTANEGLGTGVAGTIVNSGGELRLAGVSYSTAEALSINGTGVGASGALYSVGGVDSSYAGQVTVATNATIRATGNTLTLTGGIVNNGTKVTFTGGTGAVNVNAIGISGSGAGSDVIVDNVSVALNAASTYNGTTTIRNAGTLNANVAAAIPSATRSAFILDDIGGGNSTLGINGNTNQVAASLTGAASSFVGITGGSTLTVGTSSGITTFAGTVTGLGSLVKDGASTQVLSGANVGFTGDVTVQGGTLKLDISGSISGSANVTVGGVGSSGAVLDVTTKTGGLTIGGSQTLRGIGQIDGNTTITGTHSPGNSPGLQTFNGNLIYSTGSLLNWELASNTVSGRGTSFDGIDVIGAGVLTIQSGVTSNLIFNGLGSTVNFTDSFWTSNHSWLVYDDVNGPSLASGTVFDTINVSADSASNALSTGSFSWQQIANDVFLNFTVTPVPEPTSLITGLLCLAVASARRRRRSVV